MSMQRINSEYTIGKSCEVRISATTKRFDTKI